MTYQANQPSKEWAKYNSQNLANQRTKQPVDGPSTSLQNFKTNQPSNWWNKYKSPNLPNQPTDQLMDQVQISKPTKPTNWPDSGRCLETRVCDINKDNTSFITTFITSPHPRPSNLYLNRGRCYEARGTGFGVTQQARSGNDVSKLCHFVDSKDHNFLPAGQSLVECYATLHPALLVCPSVRPSVRHTLLFWFFAVYGLTAPAQMIKWPPIQPLPTRTRLG